MVVAMAGVVLLVGIASVAAQQNGPSATRSFDKASVAPGGTVTVTIQVANYGGIGRVTETLPAGFAYVSSTHDSAGVNVNGQEVRFTLQGDSSVTYTVTASRTAGSHSFSGMLRDSDRANHPVGGADSVTVEPPSATRSFNPARVAPGGTVTVTIQVANYGGIGRVTETLPAGFAYVSSTHDSAGVNVNGQEVRFTLQGDSSVAYTVTASRTAGSHSFSGMLRDSDLANDTVGGADSVTVEAPSATRSFNPARVAPGGTVTVTIQVANYGGIGRVTETLPAGFAYVSSTHDLAGVNVNGQEVRFTLQGDSSVAYTVTASRTAGSHSFSGMLRDSDRANHPVGGATKVTVRTPQPAPPPSPPANRPPVFSSPAAVSVAENTTTVVTVRATDIDSQDTVTGYAIGSGADSGKFSIVAATGELSFTTAPDFENPADVGANNEYVVAVRATSGAGGRAKTATQTIMVRVTDVVEGPALNPYDVDDSGVIGITEVLQAVKDYFDGDIDATQVLAVVKLYFDGRSS